MKTVIRSEESPYSAETAEILKFYFLNTRSIQVKDIKISRREPSVYEIDIGTSHKVLYYILYNHRQSSVDYEFYELSNTTNDLCDKQKPVVAVELTKNTPREGGNHTDQRSAKFLYHANDYPDCICLYWTITR